MVSLCLSICWRIIHHTGNALQSAWEHSMDKCSRRNTTEPCAWINVFIGETSVLVHLPACAGVDKSMHGTREEQDILQQMKHSMHESKHYSFQRTALFDDLSLSLKSWVFLHFNSYTKGALLLSCITRTAAVAALRSSSRLSSHPHALKFSVLRV